MSKLVEDNFLELIPRDPLPSIAGAVLVGRIVWVNWPVFGFMAIDDDKVHFFRVDENEELATGQLHGWVYELGRSIPPEQLELLEFYRK